MILFINLCIHWARAALIANYTQAEVYGADPWSEEAQRIANVYLNSGASNHLWMIKHEFCFPIGEVAAVSLKNSDNSSKVEFCSEDELDDIRQHHADCDLHEEHVVYYYTDAPKRWPELWVKTS